MEHGQGAVGIVVDRDLDLDEVVPVGVLSTAAIVDGCLNL